MELVSLHMLILHMPQYACLVMTDLDCPCTFITRVAERAEEAERQCETPTPLISKHTQWNQLAFLR